MDKKATKKKQSFCFWSSYLGIYLYILETMDSTDDSQTDIFATQVPPKKKVFKTSSAPPYRPSTHVQDLDYKWIIIFKWGGDIDFPFELVPVNVFGPDELSSNFLSGILSPLSRLKHREMSAYPDFSISIFAKVEKRK